MNLQQRLKKAEQQMRTKGADNAHLIVIPPDGNKEAAERKYRAENNAGAEDCLIFVNFIEPESRAREV